VYKRKETLKMFDFIRKRAGVLTCIAALMIATVLFVASPHAAGVFNRGTHLINAFWRMDANSEIEFISGSTLDLQSGATLNMDGTLDLASATVTLANSRTIDLNIVNGYIDGTGIIGADGTTAPGIAEIDGIPAIVFADDEVTPVQWTFRLPDDYSTALSFRVLASESSDTTNSEIDFAIWSNSDAAVFDAAKVDQTAVALADSAATNEVVTLTVDSTGLAQCTAGYWITLELFNTTTGDGSLEIKGVQALYTAVSL